MPTAINPLPSLIRASAFDAANMRIHKEGRSKWNDDDWNAMCDTQERLITACYGKKDDTDPNIKYIRFGIAEQMQREGLFTLRSKVADVFAVIEQALAA